MIVIRPTLPGDSWLIKADLREAEVLELAALDATCDECMSLGMVFSDAHTFFINGECGGMFGVIPYEDHNVLWGVFTRAIERHPLAFLRASRRYVESLSCVVVNYVDARNVKAVEWFRWLGFQVSEPAPYGPHGELFHMFTNARPVATRCAAERKAA